MFELELNKLYSKRKEMQEKKRAQGLNNPSSVSEILFRGQADSKWKLETTLDRHIKKEISFVDYYKLIYSAKPQIESFTGKTWDMPNVSEYPGNLVNAEVDSYMVYMRHHGFPSPLLDWTTSPYIAAFFAYRNVDKKAKKVSVYAYIEKTGEGKAPSNGKPFVSNYCFFGKAHKRHFLQQCQYTYCYQIRDNVDYYSRHEDVFCENRQNQDKLWKFILPASERINFLKKLDSMNINPFSFFATEESLMESMALREIEFKL